MGAGPPGASPRWALYQTQAGCRPVPVGDVGGPVELGVLYFRVGEKLVGKCSELVNRPQTPSRVPLGLRDGQLHRYTTRRQPVVHSDRSYRPWGSSCISIRFGGLRHRDQPASSGGLPTGAKVIKNDDFLTENETSPNHPRGAQGHSGHPYGPGNGRYDLLRPPM